MVSWERSSHCENTRITFGLVSVLTLQAWKKRWFVLRSGRLTGDPDVLEYYKNDHAKKPIRVIDLNLCEQVWFHITTDLQCPVQNFSIYTVYIQTINSGDCRNSVNAEVAIRKLLLTNCKYLAVLC